MGGTPLGNRYALTALRDKRATLAGEIDALKGQVEWKVKQLAAVDATLELFDADYQPGQIPARKTYKRIHLFKQGELGRTVLAALRELGTSAPLPAVIEAVKRLLNMDDSQKRVLRVRVRAALAYQEKHGKVAKVGARAGALWALAPDPQETLRIPARGRSSGQSQ